MGDPTGISGAVLGAIVQELVQLAKTARRCEDNCNKLAETLKHVEPIARKLSQSAMHPSIECEKWLNDLVKDLENAKEVVSRCKPCPWWKPFSYMSRVKLSKSLVSIDASINAKVQRAGLFQFGMIEEIYQRGMVKDVKVVDFVFQPTPKVIVDFKGNVLQELLGHVLKGDVMEEPMTIGLKGQGGVGKTLLANIVYNDERVREKFGSDCMIYVTIGRDASISSLYKVLAKGLGVGTMFDGEYAFRKEEDQRSYLMGIFLKKKVFLVLDDAWENGGIISWLDIAKGLGSITLVTTRNKIVISSMKANVILDVESLSEDQSWKLFRTHAFGSNLPPSHEIEKVAQQICVECNGLPLALEVIGSAMWEKKDVRLWESTLTYMEMSQKMCNSNIVDNRLFKCLRFSYDELDSASKKCFLYVAAYPEDYAIPIDEICSIWVEDDMFEAYDKDVRVQLAYDHLTSLGDRSMIELNEDRGTMRVHDILRDLAIRIIHEANLDEWASGCYFHPGKILKKLPPVKGVMKRMSFIGSTIPELPMNFQVSNVRVCLLFETKVCNGLQCLTIPNCFFDNMEKVQLLQIEYSLISQESINDLLGPLQFFESIRKLKYLTSLTLNGCKSMQILPQSIGELKSLTSLGLRGCESLKELPQSIGELKSLTCLDLSSCESLKELPQSIGELKSLTKLRFRGCKSLKELPQSIGELKSL